MFISSIATFEDFPVFVSGYNCTFLFYKTVFLVTAKLFTTTQASLFEVGAPNAAKQMSFSRTLFHLNLKSQSVK